MDKLIKQALRSGEIIKTVREFVSRGETHREPFSIDAIYSTKPSGMGMGLALQITLQGSKFWKDEDLNSP